MIYHLFIHLRSCLGEIPLRSIESLEITAANEAIAILKERFDNRAIIFQAHIKEIFNISKVNEACPIGIRSIVDIVNSNIRSLNSLGSQEELINVLLFYLVRSKVDNDTLFKWDDSFSCENLPT